MSFLLCPPTVFVIGDEYEILVNTVFPGIISVTVGQNTYYEENCGTLSSEKNYAKIRLPQKELDSVGIYTVEYRKTVCRKAYFSQFLEVEKAEFEFKPIVKEDGINIYHIADIHYQFDLAKKTVSFFGNDTDLYIFNGDMGEVESEENYKDICALIGEISGGRVPVVFSRGNHDTRGRLAERYTDYFPSDGKNTYYTFNISGLYGIVLDCGEDKSDDHPEYGGTAAFHQYRINQGCFLESLEGRDNKVTFAVCHICPADTTEHKESVFDIEGPVYEWWNKELERLNVGFMLCGHVHRAYVLEKNSNKSLRYNPYHVIVGSERQKNNLIGAAVTVYKNRVVVKLTDSFHNIKNEFILGLEE